MSRVSAAYDRLRSGAAVQRLLSSIAGRAVSRSRRLDLSTHALAFGAQQLLCTVPLVVAISAVAPHGPDRGVAFATVNLFGLDGSSASATRQLLGRHSSSISVSTLVVSMIAALVLTTSVGAVQQRAFELIWNVPNVRGMRAYLRQLAWAPTLAVFTVAVLAAAGPGRWLDEHVSGAGDWLAGLIRLLLIVGFYTWSQYWLLDRRIPARRLLPGAVAVGVLAMLLVEGSRLVMPGEISWQADAYGLVGVGFAFAAWLMILSVLVYVGVLFGALLAEGRTAN
jgi:membrane protein